MKKFLLLSFLAVFAIQLVNSQTVMQSNEEEGTELFASTNEVILTGMTQAGSAIDAIPPGGLLLIPESSNDRVMAFDPMTGDLIEENFIPADPANLSTPQHALLNPAQTGILVSDQVDDVVQEYDLSGSYIGVFAPQAGGPTLNNLRGMEYHPSGDLLVSSGDGMIHRFDPAGAYVGEFIPSGTGGMTDPYDILYRSNEDDFLVAGIDNDAIYQYDVNGAFIGMFTPLGSINFPEQISIAQSNNNVLVCGFSLPSGLYEYTSTGTYVNVYNITTGIRGNYELGNGNILVTKGDGVFEIDRNNVLISTKYTGVSARLISFVPQPNINITFQVDMSEETVSPNGIHVAGSFQGWDPAGTALTDMGNDLYAVTLSLTPGDYHEYKFVNGNQWGDDESVPPECNQNGNRFITVPDHDSTLLNVCFGSCYVCNPPAANVTFQVDLSNETVSPDGIHVAGTFQGWDPAGTPMTDMGNDLYTVTLPIGIGEYHEFKYINGNAWGGDESVPPECAANNNRYFTTPATDTTLPVVCFASCDPCSIVTDVDVTFQVDMSNETISPDGIHIAGSFQGWDPAGSLMTDMGNNVYSMTFTVQSGSYHEYKFVNGNAWGQDETVPAYCNNNNNRYITAPDGDTILPAVCFGSCNICNPPPVDVTFQVDMAEQTVSAAGVHVAGSFQGWDPATTALTDMGNDVYAVTMTLGEGDYHEFKYVNGDGWGDDEVVPGECNMNGNRYLVVPPTMTTLPEVCFASCTDCPQLGYNLDLKVFLEGPYDPALKGGMKTDLLTGGVIPLGQPYNPGLPYYGNNTPVWLYNGIEAVTAIPNNVTDWIVIELRDAVDAASATGLTMVHQMAAFVLSDGTVVDLDGASQPMFDVTVNDNLFVVIWHRNHLGVMSAVPLVETAGVYSYDFTTGSGQVFGGALGYKELETGVWGMISGDGNADKQVNNSDKIDVWSVEAGGSGYLGGDYSLDSQVNNQDKNDMWAPNSGTSSQVSDEIIDLGLKSQVPE